MWYKDLCVLGVLVEHVDVPTSSNFHPVKGLSVTVNVNNSY